MDVSAICDAIVKEVEEQDKPFKGRITGLKRLGAVFQESAKDKSPVNISPVLSATGNSGTWKKLRHRAVSYDLPPEINEVNTTAYIKLDDSKVNGSIELRNVVFAYPTNPKVQVLKGVSLSIEGDGKKRLVALCGTSGCGKTSVVSMIERFFDPTEGEVLFNGVDIKKLDP